MEGHHRVALATLSEETEVRPEDLAMLCPNCHSMVHRSRSGEIDEVRRALVARGGVVNADNIKKLSPKRKG
jgi:predicted HNH restriction endonuclease